MGGVAIPSNAAPVQDFARQECRIRAGSPHVKQKVPLEREGIRVVEDTRVGASLLHRVCRGIVTGESLHHVIPIHVGRSSVDSTLLHAFR